MDKSSSPRRNLWSWFSHMVGKPLLRLGGNYLAWGWWSCKAERKWQDTEPDTRAVGEQRLSIWLVVTSRTRQQHLAHSRYLANICWMNGWEYFNSLVNLGIFNHIRLNLITDKIGDINTCFIRGCCQERLFNHAQVSYYNLDFFHKSSTLALWRS